MRLASAALMVALAAGTAAAMFRWKPEEVPVDRLVRNVEKQLDATPDSARIHYVLGRIHAIAYASGGHNLQVAPPAVRVAAAPTSTERGAWAERELPEFHPEASVLVRRGGGKLDAERLEHYRRAVLHYRRATELGPDVAIHFLGHGWLLDSGSDLAPTMGWPDGAERAMAPDDARRSALEAAVADLRSADDAKRAAAAAALRAAGGDALPLLAPLAQSSDARIREAAGPLLTDAWLDLALRSYRRTVTLARGFDELRKSVAPGADQLVSLEAARGIARILRLRPATPDVQREIADMDALVRTLGAKPSAITPIVVPLRDGATLRDLAPPGASAVFDLDGDGDAEPWEWVGPDAGLLAWRPIAGVPIDSGRRLLGARTWWVFWSDGYEPLAALDDDGDGVLRGAELDGLCLWRDADGDGASRDDEVSPVAAHGIVELAARPDGVVDGALAHSAGVRFSDGRTRPTWDWVSRRLPRPRE